MSFKFTPTFVGSRAYLELFKSGKLDESWLDRMASDAKNVIKKIDNDVNNASDARMNVISEWNIYGALLNEARRILKHDTKFGQWVKDNELDTGRASDNAARSAAMWIAETWNAGLRDWLNANAEGGYPITPLNLMKRVRAEGHEWAQANRNKKPAAIKSASATVTDQVRKVTAAVPAAKMTKLFTKLASDKTDIDDFAREIAGDKDVAAYLARIELMVEKLTAVADAIKSSMNKTSKASEPRRVATN